MVVVCTEVAERKFTSINTLKFSLKNEFRGQEVLLKRLLNKGMYSSYFVSVDCNGNIFDRVLNSPFDFKSLIGRFPTTDLMAVNSKLNIKTAA